MTSGTVDKDGDGTNDTIDDTTKQQLNEWVEII